MYLGIDIGGTSIKFAVLDENDIVNSIDSIPTDPTSGKDSIIRRITDKVNSYLSEIPEIKSIGIGVPGVVSSDGVVKIAPNLTDWKNVELASLLSKNIDIPIAIDNDANVAAIAEMELGAGRQFDSFLFFTLGTGIGGAIIFEKKLFRGMNSGAGEFGHQIINSVSDVTDGELYRMGTLEMYAGRLGIIDFAKDLLEDLKEFEPDYYNASQLAKMEYFDVEDISNTAKENDETSLEILSHIGYQIGIGITNVMNVLDIHNVVIGGGIGCDNPILLEAIDETIRERALPTIAEKAVIKAAEMKRNAGVIGAALIGKRKL